MKSFPPSIMPLAAVVLFLLATTRASDAPLGEAVGRWQVVAGEQRVTLDGGDPITMKMFVRWDTATGKSYWLRVLVTETNSLVMDWVPIREFPARPPAPTAGPPLLTR